MEQNRWIRSAWALTETKRNAKFYTLTALGKKQLAATEQSWQQTNKGVQAILNYA